MNKRRHMYRSYKQNRSIDNNTALKVTTAAAACVLAASLNSAPLYADNNFVEQIGAENPFNGVSTVNENSKPAFADLDNDGDFDAFLIDGSGDEYYYRNTGTSTNPVFVHVTDPTDDLLRYASQELAFVDFDKDGDLDVFAGSSNFFRDDATGSGPEFESIFNSNSAHPFYGVLPYYIQYSIEFVDIDKDGDYDAFAGGTYGGIDYLERQDGGGFSFFGPTDGGNPFYGVDVGGNSSPAFADIDGDGDFDAFIGGDDGTIRHYKNTGTDATPDFVEQTGVDNLFDGVDVGSNSSPVIVDIDNDGDHDFFIGENGGTIKFFKNINPDSEDDPSDSSSDDSSDETTDDTTSKKKKDDDDEGFLGCSIGASTVQANPETNASSIFSNMVSAAVTMVTPLLMVFSHRIFRRRKKANIKK